MSNNTSASTLTNTLGDLALLEGTWRGTGFNVLAVPDTSSNFNFRVIAQQYEEIISFSSLASSGAGAEGTVANRKLNETQKIAGLHYHQSVNDLVSGDNIHFENGLWLMLENPGRICRQTSVPHGNSFLANGEVLGRFPTPPNIDDTSALPLGFDISDPYVQAYVDAHATFAKQGLNLINPNQILKDHNKNLNITNTMVLRVSTEAGGMVNIPFFEPVPPADLSDPSKANEAIECPQLTSTFWVNTITDALTGEQRLELQYTQDTTINFFKHPDKDELITWPHIDIASMKKV